MARRTKGNRLAEARRTPSTMLTIGVIAALLASLLAAFAPAAGAVPAGAGIVQVPLTPPKITKQPTSVTVVEGQSASFSATATGATATQWQLSTNGGSSWQQIEGATSSTYTIASTTLAENGDEFRVVFTGGGSEVTSKTATLTVETVPVVTRQPANATASEGGTATFESTASGSPTPTVHWQSEINGGAWKDITGATSTVLTLKNVRNTQSGTEVRAVFTNGAGEATSETATLTVASAPKVTEQPKSETVTEGSSASFEANASGFPEPEVQWEASTDSGAAWSAISGQTTKKLTLSDTQASQSGNQYRARFTNSAGTTTSEAATLTVQAPPTITLQPHNALIAVGGSATFEAAAKGAPTPTVNWEVSSNGGTSWSSISGANTDVLKLTDVPLSDNGYEYRAAFTNSVGTIDTSAALLSVSATDNSAYGWGLNTHGQVGSGSSESYVDTPMPVKGLSFVTAMAGGGHHSLALIANGTVEAWGFNGFGQLGDREAVGVRTPIVVENLSHVKAIAAGGNHSLALLSNGTVMAWGDNESGQLGDGKLVESEVPVAVKQLTEVVAVAAGEEDSLALLANGTVMSWGNNEAGQLGDGTMGQHDAPVAVKDLTGVKAIAAGARFNLALLENGTVMAWGDDNHDQLGNAEVIANSDPPEGEEGSEEEEGSEVGITSTLPVPVEHLSEVASIAAGHTHSLALLKNGTVMAWGNDSEGELGDGKIEPASDTPVAVSGLSGVTEVSAGNQDSVALLGAGELMAWGSNSSAALGDGTRGGASDVPVEVTGIAGAVGVSAGGSHMLAFGEALPSVVSVSPAAGPSTGGTSVTIEGTDLSGATAVHFGTVAATSFEAESASQIRAVAPAGSGTVNVTVTTSSGTTPVTAADRYSYKLAPAVSKLSVKAGPATGGTTVTITGTEFSGVTAVDFGSVEVEASDVTVNSSTSITVVSPPNTAGTLDVTVTATGGTSAKSSKDHFKYVPVVESVSPGSGPVAGGTGVTIDGAGFALGSATKFKFGKVAAKVVECTSATSCNVTVPAAKASGTVSVTAQAGKATSAAAPGAEFTYE